jgi:hypothetical protein
MSLSGLCSASRRTGCASRASGSQAASVTRCCTCSSEVLATAWAMVSQFWRGRSVSKPVT